MSTQIGLNFRDMQINLVKGAIFRFWNPILMPKFIFLVQMNCLQSLFYFASISITKIRLQGNLTTDEVKKDILICYMLIHLLLITGLYVGGFSNAEHLNNPKGQRRKEMVCLCCLVLSTSKLVDVCRCARGYNIYIF